MSVWTIWMKWMNICLFLCHPGTCQKVYEKGPMLLPHLVQYIRLVLHASLSPWQSDSWAVAGHALTWQVSPHGSFLSGDSNHTYTHTLTTNWVKNRDDLLPPVIICIFHLVYYLKLDCKPQILYHWFINKSVTTANHSDTEGVISDTHPQANLERVTEPV